MTGSIRIDCQLPIERGIADLSDDLGLLAPAKLASMTPAERWISILLVTTTTETG